jgi:hypothetical protein
MSLKNLKHNNATVIRREIMTLPPYVIYDNDEGKKMTCGEVFDSFLSQRNNAERRSFVKSISPIFYKKATGQRYEGDTINNLGPLFVNRARQLKEFIRFLSNVNVVKPVIVTERKEDRDSKAIKKERNEKIKHYKLNLDAIRLEINDKKLNKKYKEMLIQREKKNCRTS